MIFDLLLSFALKCIAVFCFVFNLLSLHLARATWQGYKTRLKFPKKPFTNQNRTQIHKQKPIVSILRATTFTIFHLFCFCLFRAFVYLFRFLWFSLSSSAFWRLITILVTDFSWPFHCQFLDFVCLSISLLDVCSKQNASKLKRGFALSWKHRVNNGCFVLFLIIITCFFLLLFVLSI